MPELNIATGFYASASLPLAAQRCVNWLPIVPEAEALSRRALFDVPGLTQRTLTGDTIDGVNRGSQWMSDTLYHVNGQNLYSMNARNVITKEGPIGDTKRVSMANNGRYLVIVVPGIKTYVFDNTTSTLSEVSDPDFREADSVSFKDGYFIFTASDGSVFFISALNDPFSYNALDFGSAEVRPDKIVVTHVDHNELFVGGEQTIELFQNIGGSGFPFQRIPGANITKGIHARHSVVSFDNSFAFLGGGENELTSVWKLTSSSSAQKISTAAIDGAIQKYTRDEISKAFGMSYAFGGNFFVSFTFTSDRIPSKTFVFDATTSALTNELTWHERQSGVSEDRWRVSSITSAFDKLIVADLLDGRIGEFDQSSHTEYGNPIYREKASQPFFTFDGPVFASELRLHMESGVGLNTGQGSDPQIRMSFSDDGGRTFGNELWRSYGRAGRFEVLPTWRRLGRIPRHRVLRFVTTEPVMSNILRLEADAS